MLLPLLDRAGEDPSQSPGRMPDDDPIETVDAEPMLALETPLTGLPSALPAHLAAELAELLADAERYAAPAQTGQHHTRVRQPLEAVPGLVRSLPARVAAGVGPGHRPLRDLAGQARSRRSAGAPPRSPAWHGSAPHKKKTALLRDPLLELIDRTDPTTTVGLRDRALLLLGFAVGLCVRARRPGDRAPLRSPDGLGIVIRPRSNPSSSSRIAS
jgi:hypothetical protein